MALQNDKLRTAWRALNGDAGESGWRTIPIDIKGNCRLLAGRHFPGNEEAILVGFRSVNVPKDKNLPQGNGFHVNRLERNIIADGNIWVSLARLSVGSLDMFTLMAEDIVHFLNLRSTDNEENVFNAFLGRIRAWQTFMDRDGSGILSAESEVGIFGELLILQKLLESDMTMLDAVNAWHGPSGGIHDFIIRTGGIEVKTTVSQGAFPAKISSLAQLDNSLIQPLYLAAVRISLSESGMTLPVYADKLRSQLYSDAIALSIYENHLIQAGLFESHNESYTRRFSHYSTVVFYIDYAFPKLTTANVRSEIRKANYELDLALIKSTYISIDKAIENLRGI